MLRFRNVFFSGLLVAFSAAGALAYKDPSKLPVDPMELRSIVVGGGALVTGAVDSNTALAALSTVYGKTVTRRGVIAAGDAPPVTYNSSNAACSLNGGAGDGGAQIPSADGKCWVASLNFPADLRIWGADPTGVADSTTAMRRAVAATGANAIYVPAGIYKLTDMVQIGAGQTLQCAGRTQTTFLVDSATFNMSALGVFDPGTATLGAQIIDCGIRFVQPATLSRGTVIQYPPAIYVKQRPRVVLDRVRVSNAWQCAVFADNGGAGDNGGARIGVFECGGFATTATDGAIVLDDIADFLHIESLECWPYGWTDASYITVYTDQTTRCLTTRYNDGLAIDKLSSYTSDFVFNSNNPVSVNALQADGNGAKVTVNSGTVLIGNWYSSKSAVATATNSVATISGGKVSVSNIAFQAAPINGATVLVNGGALNINGGVADVQNSTTQALASVTSGALQISNVGVTLNASGNPGNRTAGVFSQGSTGSLILRNNTVQAAGGATGNVVVIGADTAGNYLSGNSFSGWAHSIPGTATGYYDLAEPETVSATPQFTTQGDFSPTVTALAGKLYRRGSYHDLQYSITFDTNAYTTASGTFRIFLGGTFVQPSLTQVACSLARTANATFASTPETYLQGQYSFFQTPVSNSTPSIWGTTAIPASKTGIVMSVNCRYPVQ